MKKNRNNTQHEKINNPVAKYAHQFNKPKVFADKTRYQRKAKHPNKEVFKRDLWQSILKTFLCGAFNTFALN